MRGIKLVKRFLWMNSSTLSYNQFIEIGLNLPSLSMATVITVQ